MQMSVGRQRAAEPFNEGRHVAVLRKGVAEGLVDLCEISARCASSSSAAPTHRTPHTPHTHTTFVHTH